MEEKVYFSMSGSTSRPRFWTFRLRIQNSRPYQQSIVQNISSLGAIAAENRRQTDDITISVDHVLYFRRELYI
jgi:hypothetical protein